MRIERKEKAYQVFQSVGRKCNGSQEQKLEKVYEDEQEGCRATALFFSTLELDVQ